MNPDDDIDVSHAEWERLNDALIADLELAGNCLDREDTQFWRRTYCRCLLALLEGTVQDMRKHTLQFYPGLLGNDEKPVLKKRLGALENAFHAFDLYTNIVGANTPLERNSEQWLVLKKAVELRNRITHPRCAEDLELSALDMVHLRVTAKVLFELAHECHRRTARALERQRQVLLKAMKRHPCKPKLDARREPRNAKRQ